MNLHIAMHDSFKNSTLYEFLGIPKDRTNKLGELAKEAWLKYASPTEQYSYPQMLHDTTEAVHTPEELFFMANILGQWYGRSCKECNAKFLLEGLLSGKLDVEVVKLAHEDPAVSLNDLIDQRLKKDMN